MQEDYDGNNVSAILELKHIIYAQQNCLSLMWTSKTGAAFISLTSNI